MVFWYRYSLTGIEGLENICLVKAMAEGTVSTNRSFEVEIEGECYALDKIPSEDSAVVKVEVDKLLGSIDLKTLVCDLGRVGGFIRIAYNGVGAAGYKYTDQKIEIQRLGYDITKLCDKSALTVSKFKRASSRILTDLQCTYEYLLDNLEEMALDTLSAVTEIAAEMKEAALELRDEFDAEGKKVIATLENTQKAEKDGQQRIKDMQDEQVEMNIKKKTEEDLMKEHQQKGIEAEARRRYLEQQEDKAISEMGKANSNPFKNIVNGLTSSYLGVEAFDTKGPERVAAELKKNRLEAIQVENALTEKRHEALSKMSEFAAKIEQCQTEESLSKCAVQALQEACSVLKHLSAVMMRAALFWEQMQQHCSTLAKSEMQSNVMKAMKYPEEKRLKVWTSRGFKIKGIQFYAGWVALNGVCTQYMEQLKITQKDLYDYITENPTQEESKQALPRLAATFLADIKRDQKALNDKDLLAQEEMKALEGPPEN